MNSSACRLSRIRTYTKRREDATVIVVTTGLLVAIMKVAWGLTVTAFSWIRRATSVSPVEIFFNRVICSRLIISASSSNAHKADISFNASWSELNPPAPRRPPKSFCESTDTARSVKDRWIAFNRIPLPLPPSPYMIYVKCL